MHHAVLHRRTGIVPNTAPVIAGLDPAIHHLRKILCKDGWIRGSSPRKTRAEFGTAPALQRTAREELRAALRPGNESGATPPKPAPDPRSNLPCPRCRSRAAPRRAPRRI